MSRLRVISILAFISLAAALIPIYRREKREALRRLRALSQVIQTPAGQVEFATAGSGYAMVVLHGMGGGYEQGLFVGRLLDSDGYRIVAPTRAGYRQTPLATGAAFEQQADSIAAVLDALDIQSAAVIGLSGGGFAAIQFAIRYPERCRALVLLSAHGPATLDFLPNRKLLWLFEGIVLADFLLWIALRLPIEEMLRLEGSSLRRLTMPGIRERVRAFIVSAFPAADWKNGTRNDIEQLFALEGKPAWPLEQITAPTLILHGNRDRIVRPASAKLHAERIPNAKLIDFADGTHFMLITHHSEISSILDDFLKREGANRVDPTP